ncbi:helix-turn-helix transcriptional regulator [Gordonia rhizosphera]|uniref:Putative MmyB family DNA-binding protein n=1 Tax=Gordonia rhizosphera NBRC 16068 TaxID=1108045 RepID=K6W141_9ACTN|nr:helix-turn-helix transcriptional regulator [Gordonia rhizosphera]GAB92875.1 putative MmyB family DNA-binding protein [Gordonia rhizosphera NBRC 16068]
MSTKDDVREFLIARRANITPERAGLPARSEDRRVPGLRREEVAMLAGVSVDYYTKLERGKIRTASESVLNAIATALQLDGVERAYLFDLARAASAGAGRRNPERARTSVRTSVQRVLDSMTVPALVYNTRQDIIGSNLLGRAMFAPMFDTEQPNMARFIFLDSRAPAFFGDWRLACSLTAAMLRFEAGRDPLNADLTALVGELSVRSPQFRICWAEQDVHEHRTGRKRYRHPEVGDLDVTYDVLELPGEHGLSITTYSAEEGSETAEKFVLLASWAAARDLEAPAVSLDP